MREILVCCALAVLAAAPLSAQGAGAITGRVTDGVNGLPLADVQVTVEGAQRAALTDTAGLFRIREVRPGWVRVRAVRIGYRPAARDSVLVRAGETVRLDLALQPRATVDTLAGIDVTTTPDIVLDPMVTATTQRITGDDLRRLPVSSLEEAISLTAGAVGSSYRGGRFGQESFILDGLQVKNQLDASTGGLGLRFPPDILTEAALVTNGFSARYGQALSGMINVVTKDGGARWAGRLAYETDRPAPDGGDYGLDRFVFAADGPLLGRSRLAVVGDVAARVDADPVSAPPPEDPLDPRNQRPNLLPHNSGETYDVAAKLTIPIGSTHTVRLFGLGSLEQRLLYEPALKYDVGFAPGRRVGASLFSLHWQYASRAQGGRSFVSDLRIARFQREFVRGPLAQPLEARFGAFSFSRLHVSGEAMAREQDTAAAQGPVPGFGVPAFAEGTPWGAPAYFVTGGGRGDLAWNRFNELRAQLDLNVGGAQADLYSGFEVVSQRVETFQRVLAYLPVGDSVPAPSAADFSPLTVAGYAEGQLRLQHDLALTAGLRVDRFDPRTTVGGQQTRARSGVSPRFAVSTVLRGATVVVSYGRFTQAPDFQYLVDAAFDDTARTGRFRAGNPNLGHETATQYEFSVRARPKSGLALRVNAYVKRLEGLIASVPFGLEPESTVFGNADYGTVLGLETLFEREYADGWGFRALVSVQSAKATATDAFQLYRRIRIDPLGDTVFPAQVDFPLDYDRRAGLTLIGLGRVNDGVGPRLGALMPLAGLEGSAILRVATGLPYSRTNAAGDTLIGLPNSSRLPTQWQVDALLRRPFRLGPARFTAYFDVRNLFGRRNIVALRRDTGTPGLDGQALDAEALAAYQAHPEPIPYESPRYRAWADLDGDGLIQGQSELLPMFRRAAQDFNQPLFAYGTPRLLRFGVEIIF